MKFALVLLLPLVLCLSLSARADDEMAVNDDLNVEAANYDNNGERIKPDMTQESNDQARENESRASLDNEVDHMDGPVHMVQAEPRQEESSYEKSLDAAQPPPPHIVDGEGAHKVSESGKFKHRYRVTKMAHKKNKAANKKVASHKKSLHGKKTKIAKSRYSSNKKKTRVAYHKHAHRSVASR
jgi:hypothetical protein